MKQTFLLILAVLLISCNTQKPKNIELIAYYWSRDEKQNRDTIIPYVRCYIYAQINENGKCVLNIKGYNKKNRFISFKIKDSKGGYKKNRSHFFKSNEEILNEAFDLINKTDLDTSMIDTKDTTCYIYDGPSISIVGKNSHGKQVRLRFIDSNRSNLSCLNLYTYLEFKGKMSFYNSRIDTTKILQAKEKLIKEIYNKDIKLVPPYLKSDVEFVPPIIKKYK
jgi:hypothetical protein